MDAQKIALFIDAENIPAKYGKLIIENLESRGEIFIRRIYGNWEKNSLRKWDEVIRHYGLRTIHQIDFNVGKNATDMSLTIDAMDVLYTKQVETFAIVSDDSDYTPLAVRLREYGIYVIGMGSKDSSSSFRHACNEYISLDSLVDDSQPAVNVEEIVTDDKTFDADTKIFELEKKIAALESKLALNELPATFKLTAEENKNSVLSNSVGKIKQKISFATPLVKAEEIAEIAAPEILNDEENPVIDISVTGIVAIAAPLPPIKTVKTIDALQPVAEIKQPDDVKEIDDVKPVDNVKILEPAAKISDKISAVELKHEIKSEKLAQVKPVDKKPVDKKVDAKIIERDKALNDRFVKCGQNGMRNPKKKMQQIHDALHESAKIHADANGFVPLNFAGQELKKKNLGFTVQDFGYALLNEFIGDFPELYELTRSKQRSFRYRCIDAAKKI